MHCLFLFCYNTIYFKFKNEHYIRFSFCCIRMKNETRLQRHSFFPTVRHCRDCVNRFSFLSYNFLLEKRGYFVSNRFSYGKYKNEKQILRSYINVYLQRHLGGGIMSAEASLTELDLSDNAFGPNGMEGLTDLLKSSSCYRLRTLKLNNNGLGTHGGKVSVFSKLHYISVSPCKLKSTF